jgi:hypothetical protein
VGEGEVLVGEGPAVDGLAARAVVVGEVTALAPVAIRWMDDFDGSSVGFSQVFDDLDRDWYIAAG